MHAGRPWGWPINSQVMEPLKYETEAPLERTWHVDVIDTLVLGEPAMLHIGLQPCRLSLGEDDAEVPKPLEQS